MHLLGSCFEHGDALLSMKFTKVVATRSQSHRDRCSVSAIWTNISVCPSYKDRYEFRKELLWWQRQYDFWVKLRKTCLHSGVERYAGSLHVPGTCFRSTQ